jgi:hypothetical protein
MLRLSFDGTVLTDRSDCQAQSTDLCVKLVADTCGGVPAAVLAWLQTVVERAVLVEFDRFISAGQLAARVAQLGAIENVSAVADFSGMNV